MGVDVARRWASSSAAARGKPRHDRPGPDPELHATAGRPGLAGSRGAAAGSGGTPAGARRDRHRARCRRRPRSSRLRRSPRPPRRSRARPPRRRPSSRHPKPKSRRGVVKWAAALVVVALVVGAAVAAAALLTGSSGTPDVLAWTPADSVTYVEARLDLPGDQQAKLAKVLSAFPGFDDQAAFPTKINEVLDQLVGKASDGKQSYTADIQPWFGGQLSREPRRHPDGRRRVEGPLPRPRQRQGRGQGHRPGRPRPSRRPARRRRPRPTTAITINVIKPGADAGAMADKVNAAYAVVGPVLAIGDEASVKAAIDTGGKKGLDTNARLQGRRGDRDRRPPRVRLRRHRGPRARPPRPWPTDVGGVARPAAPAVPRRPVPRLDRHRRSAPTTAASPSTSRRPHNAKLGARAHTAESKIPSLAPGRHVVARRHPRRRRAHRRGSRTSSPRDPSLADGVKQVDDTLKLDRRLRRRRRLDRRDRGRGHPHGRRARRRRVIVPTDAADAQRLLDPAARVPQLAGGGSGDHRQRRAVRRDDDHDHRPVAARRPRGAAASAVPGSVEISYAVTDDVVVIGTAPTS